MAATPSWRIAPVLGCRDVHEAVAFYTGILGFGCPHGVFEGVDPDEGGVYAIVTRAGVDLHLQIRRREVYPPTRERIESEVYVFVDDADALFEELHGRGATILREPEDAPYGLRDFVVEDPDGHRIVFGSPLA